MNDPKKIFQLLGMAARARMIITGEELGRTRSAFRTMRILVIVSEDASKNTHEKIN